MRTLDTQTDKVLKSSQRTEYVRFRVYKPGTGWIEVTNLEGWNFLKSVQVTADIDDPVGHAEIVLARDVFNLSLAPLVTNTNKLAASSTAIVEVSREVMVEVASMPYGMPNDGLSYNMVFHGHIDEVDWGGPDMVLHCRDLSAKLQDTWIETERLYGRWQASRNIPLGMVVVRSDDPVGTTTGAQAWRCTTAGTTGSSEPVWGSPSIGTTKSDGSVVWTYQAAQTRATSTAYSLYAIVKGHTTLQYWTCTTAGTSGSTATATLFPSAPTVGQTVTDGSVVWTYTAGLFGTPIETLLQQVIDDNLGPGVVNVTAPVPSGWYATEYKQQMESLWSAIQALTLPIGFDLRFVFDAGAGDYVLTLQEPARDAFSVSWDLTGAKILSARKTNRNVQTIRNVIKVVFSDAENWDQTNDCPARNSVTVTSASSIANYGRRFMQVSEASTSGINTLALATKFAEAMRKDLQEPVFDLEIETLPLWQLDLNDGVTVTQLAKIFDASSYDMAVVGYTHEWSEKKQTSILKLRGNPTGGQLRYSDIQAAPGIGPVSRTIPPSVSSSVSITAKAEGAIITHAFPPANLLPPGTTVAELHLSTSSGFTPSSATLKSSSLSNRFEVQGLAPGTTYYCKIAYRDNKGNLSGFTTQSSFVAKPVQNSFFVNYALSADGTYANDTVLVFDTKISDDGPWWDNSSTNTKFTAPYTANYRVHCLLNITGAVAGDRCRLYILKNNTTKVAIGPWVPAVTDGTSGIELYPEIDTVLPITAGDYIQLFSLFAGTAGTKTLRKPDPTTSPFRPGCFVDITVVR